jgi:hypothetical protein
MVCVEQVEHWWNGQWGWARLDIYLERVGSRWQVRALERLGETQELTYSDLTAAQARAYVQHLLRTAPPVGEWRDIAG